MVDEVSFRFGDILFCISYPFVEFEIKEIKNSNEKDTEILKPLVTLTKEEIDFLANQCWVFLEKWNNRGEEVE